MHDIIQLGSIILPLGVDFMYIQKKKNAYYLRESIWDSETKKPKTICTYLGSNSLAIQGELERLIPDKELLKEMRGKYFTLSLPNKQEILNNAIGDLNKYTNQAMAIEDVELHEILSEMHDRLSLYEFIHRGK